MVGVKAAAFALLLLAAPAVAQVPPVGTSDVGGPVNEAYETAAPVVANETGQDVVTEDIGLEILLDIRDAELDVVGVFFGGGKAEMRMRVSLNLSFRAVSVERIDEALRERTEGDVSLRETFGVNASRMALTAEELRLAGGGAVLEAFRPYEEAATRRLIEETLPGVTVLSVRFSWANVVPADRPREGRPADLREPPILLSAVAELEFLERLNLLDVLSARERAEDTKGDAEKTLRERIEENQTLPALERNAYMVLGARQLVSLDVPPGWRLNLSVEVPKGFTIESAGDEILVDEERRLATHYVDGAERATPFATAGVLTLSNRFLVTAALAFAGILAGTVLRFPVEAAWFAASRAWPRAPPRSEADNEVRERE